MDLEKKVQLLEQEIDVLKNQIQETLLDIKEHLLTNAHPSLRSDDSSVLQDSKPALIPAKRLEEKDRDDSANLSIVRKVSLSELSEKPQATKKSEEDDALDARSKAELDAWLNRTLKETTPERCAELIELYVETGRFDLLRRNYLLQTLKHRSQAVKPSQKSKPAPTKSRAMGTPTKPSAPKPVKANDTVQPKQTVATSDEPVDKNNLVLRLIAGIQNAGAGVRWNRKNG